MTGAATGDDRGSATLWVITCLALVLLVAEVGAARAAAVLARHRAESAADLGALAGAGRIGIDGAACAWAARVATANGARLMSCVQTIAADGRSGSVRVGVQVVVHLPLAGARTVTVAARAARLPA